MGYDMNVACTQCNQENTRHRWGLGGLTDEQLIEYGEYAKLKAAEGNNYWANRLRVAREE
jgi:hypothetical protein